MPSPSRLRSLVVVTAIVLGAGWAAQGLRAWTQGRLGEQVAARAAPGDITMLSSLVCEYCLAARTWFTAHQVPFDECFIESDAACAARFADSAAPGTPVLWVRGQRLIGFNAQAVADALEPRAR